MNSLSTRLQFASLLTARRCLPTVVATNKLSTQASSVKIPKAIKRSSTAVLETLASTVRNDFTGPSYQYIDDPYLTPLNMTDKKMFSFSKEAGKKAAKYFFEKYPQYFHRDISEPKIEAFTYREVYDENMAFDEIDLERCISKGDVTNAIICYNALMAQEGVKIDQETILDLLDLACFYNSQDAVEPEMGEDWFQRNEDDRKPLENTWKDESFAEMLFDSLEIKTSRAYSAIIQGMAKFGQVERAFAFYRQAMDLELKLNTETYNSLISVGYNLHSTNEERWKHLQEMFKTMRNNGIRPDLNTLHSSLRQIAQYKFWDPNFENAKKVYNEFAFKFGIKPTRETNNIMLNIFYKSKHATQPPPTAGGYRKKPTENNNEKKEETS